MRQTGRQNAVKNINVVLISLATARIPGDQHTERRLDLARGSQRLHITITHLTRQVVILATAGALRSNNTTTLWERSKVAEAISRAVTSSPDRYGALTSRMEATGPMTLERFGYPVRLGQIVLKKGSGATPKVLYTRLKYVESL